MTSGQGPPALPAEAVPLPHLLTVFVPLSRTGGLSGHRRTRAGSQPPAGPVGLWDPADLFGGADGLHTSRGSDPSPFGRCVPCGLSSLGDVPGQPAQSLVRTFQDSEGVSWTVFEVLRYGIGRKPVTVDTAVVVFESSEGQRHEALVGTGQVARLTQSELRELLSEVREFDAKHR